MAHSTRRKLLMQAGSAAALLASPTVLRAQDTTVLKFSPWLPPASPISRYFFQVWAEDVAKITEGRVQIDILPAPLGPPPAHLELLLNGDTDIAYSLHGYTEDLFPRAQIGQFSFLGDSYSASHAFSKVYSQLLDAQGEHDATGMKLLGVFQHGPGVIMLRDKVIREPEDFEGLRIRTSGGYIGQLINELGGENMPMSPTLVHDKMMDGSIDGVAFPWEGAAEVAFRAFEPTTFVSEVPGGYYNATWFLGMSAKAAERISPSDFALIEARSAETVHVLAAKAFDFADHQQRERFLAAGKPVEQPGEAAMARIREIAAKNEVTWSNKMADGGFDGARALGFTRRLSGNG